MTSREVSHSSMVMQPRLEVCPYVFAGGFWFPEEGMGVEEGYVFVCGGIRCGARDGLGMARMGAGGRVSARGGVTRDGLGVDAGRGGGWGAVVLEQTVCDAAWGCAVRRVRMST